MTTTVVPRIPRKSRRESRWPLLLRIIGFRIRLRLILWCREAKRGLELLGILIGLGWLWLKWKALNLLRRFLDWILLPRRQS